MISIKNFKTYGDLKEEHTSLNEQLAFLKSQKFDLFYEEAISLLRFIQKELKLLDLEIENNSINNNFVAKYKGSNLMGEVVKQNNSLNFLFNGEVIATFEVQPKPHTTIYTQGISVNQDMIKNRILDLEEGIRNIKDEIKALESNEYVYVLKNKDKNTIFYKKMEVMNQLIK